MEDRFTRGLILIEPYGTYVIENKKKIIVKSKKNSTISNENILLIENKKGIALIKLTSPVEIDLLQFKKMYKYHLINEHDRKQWWLNYKKLYTHKITELIKFKRPILLDYFTESQVQVLLKNILIKHIYIGISGFYPNVKKYNTNLNSVEINCTFYKFPTTSLIENLKKLDFTYSIKVNRMITHFKQLKDVNELWKTFYQLCKPIHKNIKCFLFQFNKRFMPNENTFEKIKKISKILKKEHKYVFEFRHDDWFKKENIEFINNLGIIVCSLYSYHYNFINNYDNTCYFRLHGTKEKIYHGNYSNKQLEYLFNFVANNKINNAFFYFNNTDDNSAIIDSDRFIKKYNNINL